MVHHFFTSNDIYQQVLNFPQIPIFHNQIPTIWRMFVFRKHDNVPSEMSMLISLQCIDFDFLCKYRHNVCVYFQKGHNTIFWAHFLVVFLFHFHPFCRFLSMCQVQMVHILEPSLLNQKEMCRVSFSPCC